MGLIGLILILGRLLEVFSFKLVLVENVPMVSCSKEGYEYELLTKAISSHGYLEDKDYTVECAQSIEAGSYSNAIIIGGIRTRNQLIQQGFEFSVPTYTSGLNFLVKKVNLDDRWRLFNVFSFELWVLIVFTPCGVGLCNWLYNMIIASSPLEALKDFNMLLKLIWDSYLNFMKLNLPGGIGLAKFLNLILGITMVLLFYGYLAGYVCFLNRELKTNITSFAEIAGELVLVDPTFERMAGQYSVYYYRFNEDFHTNFEKFLDLLDNGEIMAILADHAFLSHKAQIHDSFILNTNPLLRYDFAALFTQDLNSDVAFNINSKLAEMHFNGESTKLAGSYKLYIDKETENQPSIDVFDVVGFYSIIVGTSALAIALSLIPIPLFRSQTWGNLFIKNPGLTEADYMITQRQESEIEMQRKTNSEVSLAIENMNEGNTDSAPIPFTPELSPEMIKILRSTTLALIMYEQAYINDIDQLLSLIGSQQQRTSKLLEAISKSISK